MKFIEIKKVMLGLYWERCPFTGTTIKSHNFNPKGINIDHIYSIPRSRIKNSTKSKYRDQFEDVFESIFNLRPLAHSAHINMQPEYEYHSPLKWTGEQFMIFASLLEDPIYDPLKMHYFTNNNKIIELSYKGFIEAEIDIPDWWLPLYK